MAAFIAGSARGEPAMWVVKDNDSTIYLIGTAHILRPETVWNAPKITRAVEESTELWLEIADDGTQAALALVPKYGFDANGSLTKRLKPKQKARLAKLAARYGLPLAAVDKMKPWMAAFALTALPLQNAGYDANAGVEEVLRKQAKAEGDKIAGLETVEEQFQLLDGIPERDQLLLLDETLGDLEEGLGLFEKMTKAWSDGDTEALAKLTIDDMKKARSVYDRLVVQRNIRWSEKIVEMLKGSGVQTIAVGAGHLVGPDSVQAQLRKRGIEAVRD